MTTLLVANRGEIARRVFRTAKRLGMRTVAVHSDADAGMPFVGEADLAVRIGPAAARESYLDVDRVVAAARECRADLVHPGYGFLAEDPRLASALERAGIAFVGPPPEVLALLGDKARAKGIAAKAKAPLLPDARGDDQRDEAFLSAAARIGYPVMVKPVAGGGGIGMHLVAEERGLRDALARARRQAAAAFGDERVFIERAVTTPRHVEVQILADAHGTLVALGERDCSAQRRHQKVIEESPSPAVDDALRARLEAAALAIAREARYVNAGTVEFLLDGAGSFYFIEVNARLQVEHPVTEAVYGVDLVEQQLRIALGERLQLTPRARGHAIEARVYAEDPANAFAPSTGRLVHVEWPEGVRVDAGVEQGSVVTRHYDPMLAKIIAQGSDRASALDALAHALDRTIVLGVRTNLPFLRALVAHPDVRAGRVDTGLVDRELARLAPREAEPPPEGLAVAAAAVVAERVAAAEATDPWAALGAWRMGGERSGLVSLGERALRVAGEGPYRVGGVTVERAEGRGWTVGGDRAIAVRGGGSMWVAWRGLTHEITLEPAERGVDALAAADVTAPMPGVVLSVEARDGQRVSRGDLLAVLEAMKMEMRVEAPAAGTVTKVLCAPGQQVARRQRLVEFEPDAA
ncbi:MAG TPA: biotin carboxylase N-terminal domain-containing protein [Candidatus Limnocylindria bacterium]|nr:biotin carboxylase N-terminal domain-containing protein [Candidatus Limnocylindria bacterium]